jgi:hypothetical protein
MSGLGRLKQVAMDAQKQFRGQGRGRHSALQFGDAKAEPRSRHWPKHSCGELGAPSTTAIPVIPSRLIMPSSSFASHHRTQCRLREVDVLYRSPWFFERLAQAEGDGLKMWLQRREIRVPKSIQMQVSGGGRDDDRGSPCGAWEATQRRGFSRLQSEEANVPQARLFPCPWPAEEGFEPRHTDYDPARRSTKLTVGPGRVE